MLIESHNPQAQCLLTEPINRGPAPTYNPLLYMYIKIGVCSIGVVSGYVNGENCSI